MRASAEERFWARVERTDTCWLWRGHLTRLGYGGLWVNYKYWSAHRYAWTLTRGAIPDRKHVCHSCDVRNCVNPEHLWLGTHSDNMRDMHAKGRASDNRGRANPLAGHPGESNCKAKLTEADVQWIRANYYRGGYRNPLGQAGMARRFDVTVSTIHGVVTGRTWKGAHAGGGRAASS
jgi:hypothetical protein